MAEKLTPWLLGCGVLVGAALFCWFLKSSGDRQDARYRAHDARRDRACERAFILSCLDHARGPQSTHYTDQEETVVTCATVAETTCLREAK